MEDCVEEELGALGEVFGASVFGGVVGDAGLAWDEEHGAGAEGGDEDAVVAGCCDHVACREALGGGVGAEEGVQGGVEGYGAEGGIGVDVGLNAAAGGDFGDGGAEAGLHGGGLGRVLVAEVEVEAGLGGDGAADVGVVLDPGGGGSALGFGLDAELFGGEDDLGGGGEAVLAAVHGGGAGVAGGAGQGEVEVAGLDRGGHDTDGGVGGFEDGALLDVRFQPGGPVPGGGAGQAELGVVDEGFGYGDAVVVLGGEGGFQGEGAGVDAAAHHGGGEAAAFLVGPDDEFEGGLGLGILEGSEEFQAGEDAEDAVEAAAGGDGVEVGAEGDGGAGGVCAGAVEEEVAYGVPV